ncbi:MAG: GGDEF domain-containing protein [Campylobacterales bacterium]|nr:GGDEF domain-containing protein [Campylobacterales bacterium]
MNIDQFKDIVNKHLNNTTSLIEDNNIDTQVVTYFITAILDEFKLSSNKEAIEKFKTCIDSIKESLAIYAQSNENLDTLTKDNFTKINDSIDSLDKSELKKHFDEFHNRLITHINDANSKIKEIATKINHLEENSQIDKLTKLFNMKALKEDLNIILMHGLDKKLDLNILTININNFSNFSTIYGQEIVKKTNLFLSLVIKSLVRKENRIYRVSDYRFVIIFNRSHTDDTTNSAKRILNHLNKNRVIYNNVDVKFFTTLIIYSHQKGDTFNNIFEKIGNSFSALCFNENNTIVNI